MTGTAPALGPSPVCEGVTVNDVRIYPAQSGGWIYEVWIAARPVVIGWCHTREGALEASLA